MRIRHIALAAGTAALVAGLGTPAAAQEVTIRAVSGFPKGSFLSQRIEAMVEELNEKGKGKLRIQYVGGAPEIGAPTEVVQKVAQGLFDLASVPGAYYQNVLPEADAWKLMEISPTEVRKNGGWEYMDKLHREKNLTVLARTHYGAQFHLYLGEGRAIDKPDLSGVHLRATAAFRPFFQALGATTQDSTMAEIYTLMENRTVAGTGWPVAWLQPDWLKVFRYRVDPGFYSPDILILMNLQVWEKLPEETRGLIRSTALKYEQEGMAADIKAAEEAKKKQADAGIETIEFTGTDREKWENAAREAGWGTVLRTSPEHGAKLREFFVKE